ncbi:MAG: hypothetical protein IJ581_04600, partial [Paludibacteraceae bacterium]|nr:hypothetical protein [Paludibacteraceae bacterium]
MRKLFLIPLLACFSCVMAWGANVARIGETNYTSFNTAFAAATDGQTIVLLANIAKASSVANESRTVSANITIDGQGQYSISRAFIVSADKTLTLKDVTVSNKVKPSNSRTIMLNAGATLVMDNATVVPGVASCIAIGMPKAASAGSTATIELKEGTNNTISNITGSSTMYAYNYSASKKNGKIIITGDGALQVNHVGESGYLFTGHASYGGSFVVDAKNATFTAENADHLFGSLATMTLSEGVYSENPTSARVADGSVLLESGDNYKVLTLTKESAAANGIVATIDKEVYTSLSAAINAASQGETITLWADAVSIAIGKAISINANGCNASSIAPANGYVMSNEGDIYTFGGVARIDDTHYTSLAAALNAAPKAALITLWADASATTINQSVVINKNGFSAALTAGSGYVETVEDTYYIYAADASEFAAFLAAEGTASYTLTEDIDIALAGSLPVNGTKTLTIPSGKKIFYQRQGLDANILVNEGAKLTILGNGSIEPAQGTEIETSADMAYQMGCWAIRVDGELVVGVENADQPHFVSTAGRISGASNYHGAPIHITETGIATINNIDIHAAQATFWNGGETTVNGGEFISVSSSQGGLGAYSYALQNYGKMIINDIHVQGTHGGFACTNIKTDAEIVEGFAQSANAIINGGTFETVHGKNFITGTDNAKDNYYAIYVANFGIINIYDGNFKVQTQSAGSNKVALIGNNDSYNSYGVINIYGGNFQDKVKVQKRKSENSVYPSSIPLSSQWYSSFGTEAPLPAGYEYYETGDETYLYGVRRIPGTEVSEVVSDAATIPWQQNTTWAGTEIPEESTIVTIPVGKTVVVSKDEDEKSAKAQQVFVSKNASLTIEEGTTLTVGDGGVNIAYGGSLTVKPGAMVKIGAAGVITAEKEALVLESTEDAQAVLLYDPAVAENTQPQATVRLTTKAKQISSNPWNYIYQRIAIPVLEPVVPENNFVEGTHGFYPGESAYGFESYLYYWTGRNWANTTWLGTEPFKGYQLANNSLNGGVVYSFTGNLVG